MNAQNIKLTGSGAGTCHVELTFGNGATSSVDVDFMAMPPPLPGCDEEFAAVTADGSLCNGSCNGWFTVSAPDPLCDAGLEAGLEVDAPSEAAVDAQVDAGGGG
jgi:hypothetical protein